MQSKLYNSFVYQKEKLSNAGIAPRFDTSNIKPELFPVSQCSNLALSLNNANLDMLGRLLIQE